MKAIITITAILAMTTCPLYDYGQANPQVKDKKSFTHSEESFTVDYPQNWIRTDTSSSDILLALEDINNAEQKIRLVEISKSRKQSEEIEEVGTMTSVWLKSNFPDSETYAYIIETPYELRAAHFMSKYEYEGTKIAAYRTVFIKGEYQYTILQITEAIDEDMYVSDFISLVNSFRWNE